MRRKGGLVLKELCPVDRTSPITIEATVTATTNFGTEPLGTCIEPCSDHVPKTCQGLGSREHTGSWTLRAPGCVETTFLLLLIM